MEQFGVDLEMDWLSLIPPFFGVLLAFAVERLWKKIEDRFSRSRFLQGVKKELESCSEKLVGKGHLLPTNLWESGKATGLINLLSYKLKVELSTIYFKIQCHNYEAEKVRQVSILATTTQEKPKAEIEAELKGRKAVVTTPWTYLCRVTPQQALCWTREG